MFSVSVETNGTQSERHMERATNIHHRHQIKWKKETLLNIQSTLILDFSGTKLCIKYTCTQSISYKHSANKHSFPKHNHFPRFTARFLHQICRRPTFCWIAMWTSGRFAILVTVNAVPRIIYRMASLATKANTFN